MTVAERSPTVRARQPHRRPIRVLLLEDNATDRILVEELLRNCAEAAFELVCFSRLAPALNCLKTRTFDVAVIDMVLPDAAGMEIYNRIRELAPFLPVVVLTASSDTSRFDALLKAGAQDCLVKLHPLGQLLPRAIRYAIERYRIHEELTQRVKELARSEARLHSLIDANSDAMLIVDRSGAVRFANRSAALMFGFTPSELAGRNLGLPQASDRAVELDIVRRDGKRGRAELKILPMVWEGENAWLAALRDITERAAAAASLRQSEAEIRIKENHLASAQRLASIGSFEIDFATGAFSCSKEFCKIHSLAPSACRDYDGLLGPIVAPEERRYIEDNLAIARSGRTPPTLEYRFRRSDGQERRVERRSEVLFDQNGRPSGVLGVVRDITDLRQAEAREAEIAEQLRHAQKIDALGTLAGGIAHDLNNTLVPIRVLAPVLKRGPKRSEQEQRCLDLIVAAAARASQLVRQILAFSRKQTLERQPVRLDELVKDSLAMLRAGIPAFVRIGTEIAAVPGILANPGQLCQVLLNLVLNAAQAVGEQPGVIIIGVAPDPQGVRLSVTDTGSGMDEATQRRIFEPFFTTKAASEGTGLGLSVVKGIITEHDGAISVTSKLGAGTRFDVIFPSFLKEAD
ncbi:MAG TPA: PAS domain S-box protein [Rhizomicrobium sp.]|nr:PAS domain S-box protein [Rhizomicrobium sp.]